MFKNVGYGPDSPSDLFLGIETGEAVAASRAFHACGITGIWHVATVPKARGKGYGTAMTQAAAKAGLSRGYRFAGLFSTPAGLGVYQRLGFKESTHVNVYKSPEMI